MPMAERAFAWVQASLNDDELTFEPLKAEASHRAFYRVEPATAGSAARASAVLMVSPPDKEQNAQFERLARIFADSGLPVPTILNLQPEHGWYLLTDLGRRDLASIYGTPDEEAALRLAITTLIRLQQVRDDAIPPYTVQRFTDELSIFSEWFVHGLLDSSLPGAVASVFDALVERTRNQPQCCVHRDYHCRNLLYDPTDGRLGIVDFQDALIGPASYDLASLLHDCYHEFTSAEIGRWIDFYLDRTSLALDRSSFKEDLDYVAVQRQLKAIGIFVRLRLRDQKRTHLAYIPPVLDHLIGLTRRHEALFPLARWLEDLDRGLIADRLAGLAAT